MVRELITKAVHIVEVEESIKDAVRREVKGENNLYVSEILDLTEDEIPIYTISVEWRET